MTTQTPTPTAAPAPGATIPKRVRLAAILEDRRVWPRDELDIDRVKQFQDLYADAESVAQVPPVMLAPLPANMRAPVERGAPDGPRYLIVDGHHRLAALKRLRQTVAPAIIRTDLTTFDAIYKEACATCSASAKPLTGAEKRAAVRRLLKTTPKIPEREIARIVGCSVKTVYNQSHTLARLLSQAGDALSGNGNKGPGRPAKTQYDRFMDFLYHRDVGQPSHDDIAAMRRDFAESQEVRDIAVAWARAVAEAIQPPQAAPPASVSYKS